MKKKITASFLLAILLVFNLCTPIAYAVDSTGGASPSSQTQDTSETTKIKVAVEVRDAQTKQALSDGTITLKEKDNQQSIGTWKTSGDSKEYSLEKGKTYLFSAAAADYHTLVEKELKVSEDGKLLLLEKGAWQEQENQKLIVELAKIEPEKKETPSSSADSSSEPSRALPRTTFKSVADDMVTFRSGSTDPIPPTTPITPNMISPINKLQITKDLPNTKVEILAQGAGVTKTDHFKKVSTDEENTLWAGEYLNGWDNNINGNALAVKFKSSDKHARNYSKDSEAGWDSREHSLATTSMWVKVKYTNAAYYDGRLVDAVATIKVTPYKNRNLTEKNATEDSERYHGTYTPNIQIGYSLYNGWSWNNVKEINVNLQFYEKGSSQPIQFQGGKYEDEEATYYTINSLNEANEIYGQQNIGPEYVLPKKGSYTAAYTIGKPPSHIQNYYDGWKKGGRQYAYNGGTEKWDGDNDRNHPNWSQNSTLFTTSNTNSLDFTMGNLMRDPRKKDWVTKTDYVWATISTDSFNGSYVNYKDISVDKKWIEPKPGSEQDYKHPDVTAELWATWKQNGVTQKSLRQKQTLSEANGFKAKFIQVPDEASMTKIIQKKYPGATITDFKYEVRESQAPPGYTTTYQGSSTAASGFTISNKKITSGLTIKKTWWNDLKDKEIPYSETKRFRPVTIRLKRKVNGVIDTKFNKVTNLTYFNKWTVPETELAMKDNFGNDYTYYIEEVTSSLRDNFYLKSYSHPNGIILKPQANQNELGVTNADSSVPITFKKLWYDKDGNAIANDRLPTTLTVKLYRTTDGKTTGGTLVDTISLKRSSKNGSYVWETVKEYPYLDKTTKQRYTYYIEEEKPQGYLEISQPNEKFVTFSDGVPLAAATLTVKNKVNPSYPKTGGSGILLYVIIGMISLLSGGVLYLIYLQKSRKVS